MSTFFFVNSALTVQSGNNLMRNNDDVDEGTLQKWDDRYVHLLIAAYDHHKHVFKSSGRKVAKKQVFQRIAEYFNVTADVTVSGDQYLRKWTKLEQKYKEVKDNNRRTGKGRKDWKFLHNMTTCLTQHLHLMHQLNIRNPDLHPNQLTAALTMEIAQTQVVMMLIMMQM